MYNYFYPQSPVTLRNNFWYRNMQSWLNGDPSVIIFVYMQSDLNLWDILTNQPDLLCSKQLKLIFMRMPAGFRN